MSDEAESLREKLTRYRYLHRMIEDAAMRATLDDDIAAMERQLATLDGDATDETC